MIKPHVRLSIGQKVLYTRFPDRVSIVEAIHDRFTPVSYDIGIPLTDSIDGLQGTKLHARGISPQDLRAVDEISL